MQHTVTFRKSSVENGRTILHELTICETDETKLKREITKIAKTVEPFAELQKACPVPWENHGYGTTKSCSKNWSPYNDKYPFDGDETYCISIMRTSALLDTASSKIYQTGYNVKKAYDELTSQTAAFNPDVAKIDPELAEIINTDLPSKVLALQEIIEAAEKRVKDKINELNSMTEN